jgi:DNA-binding MarR family transcriptional regulator
MTEPDRAFDLQEFLPYLLNQAAEATSRGFETQYRNLYGMTRTQWRVLANLGKFGAMTARDICAISHIEKTKVSRAVAALEQAQMLFREVSSKDRRAELLSLTETGKAVFVELGQLAVAFDAQLRDQLGPAEVKQLIALLGRLVALSPQAEPDIGAGQDTATT